MDIYEWVVGWDNGMSKTTLLEEDDVDRFGLGEGEEVM